MTKKALMVIASQNFRDEEYFQPKEILEREGIETKTASSVLGERRGVLGGRVAPDLRLKQVELDDFDALIFVGGAGAKEYFHSTLVLNLVKKAIDSGKVVAAICIAPVILANAGVLEGKRATVFPSESEQLRNKKAIYSEEAVVVDGRVVTANGPAAAKEFGEKIAEMILKS